MPAKPAKHLITLYDIRSKLDPPAWSPNVWKARFVLNYKKLPCVTQWLAWPDVTDVLSSIGAAPTRMEKPYYTVPVIVDQVEGKPAVVVSDSLDIADYLEHKYPEPPIYPGGRDKQMMYHMMISQNTSSNMFVMVAPNLTRILPEGREREFYVSSRKEIFGVGLDEIFRPEVHDAMWARVYRGLDNLSGFTDRIEHGEQWLFSPVEGPTYADFVLGAILNWFKIAGPEGAWDRIKGRNNGKWERHMQNLQPYMELL